MDEQELIQVNFQLPASALDGLARLTEQLRKLTAAVNGPGISNGTPEEIVESGSFDLERFQALRQQAEGTHSPQAETSEARSVRSDVSEHVQEPEDAGWTPESGTGSPDQEDFYSREDVTDPEASTREAGRTHEETTEEIPVVQPEMEDQTLEAPSVRMEPESQIPEAEEVWAQTGEAELPLPAAQAEIQEGVVSPLGAGMVVTAQPEPPASRWTGLTEELVTAGPAPLTAEAVSLAFQRDGRRYDNGFPLY
ncbi:MAG: hypothetical protein HDT20_03400 [Oscillibacter sp.]|nr:hypothetical protein [Oscillibacter sp.]